ncbi:glycosyltransferase family 52 [Canicola haemoglobinophilus]|nr:glycosyltransferase family 52 [Canicola haemoglobinophilus]
MQLMISPINNKKYRHYYSLLEQVCDDSLFLYRNQKLFSWFSSYVKIRVFLRNKTIKNIYISNINDELIHMIVDLFNDASVYTFDDGTANILKTSSFYYRDVRFISYMLRRILGIKTTMHTIRNKSKLHYTIYPNISNIIDRTFPIKLFNEIEVKKKSILIDRKALRIFLGQPFYCSDKKNLDLISKLVKDLNIDFYVPHPRENYFIKDIKYIDSELIFEDIFERYFLGQQCIIYTFFSSAILSLLEVKNVSLVSIKPIDVHETIIESKALSECYGLFKKLGVDIVKAY